MSAVTKIVSMVLLLLTLVAVFIGNTAPIQDGDTWWQMAYGKYLIENKTLIPNHSIYTWTPADNSEIYCAWIAEIFLYKIFQFGGLGSFYALKYGVGILAMLLLLFYAYRRGVHWHPVNGLTILAFVLIYGSSSGSFVKPEMFSFILMTLIAFLWWYIRDRGRTAWRHVYLFPVIMLIWVNSHGGFVFGFPFLGLVFLGDVLNARFNSAEALDPKTRFHLFVSLLISALTVFMTPYGLRYPMSLARLFLGGQDLGHLRSVAAYMPSLSTPTNVLYFILPLLLLSYAILAMRKLSAIDWGLILTNIAYGFIYTIYGRMIFYWAPVFAFSVISLLHRDRVLVVHQKKWISAISLAVIALIGVDQVRWQAYKALIANPNWFGLGVGYVNSLEETEYISRHFRSYKIGNDYNSGGYLLWRLGPQAKIMIDPRYFPFRNWYDRYLLFRNGKDMPEFMRDFKFDVIHLQYVTDRAYPYFLNSPAWKMAFYGTAGIVFVRKEIPLPGNQATRGPGIYFCRSLPQSIMILCFAVRIGDWKAAEMILENMKARFTWTDQAGFVTAAEDLYRGTKYFFNREYEKALDLFKKSKGKVPQNPDILQALYYYKAVDLWTADDVKGALEFVNRARALNGDDLYGLFNLAVIKRSLVQKQSGSTGQFSGMPEVISDTLLETQWKNHLGEFIKRTAGNADAAAAIGIAQRLLEGTYIGKPPLLYPPEPPISNK